MIFLGPSWAILPPTPQRAPPLRDWLSFRRTFAAGSARWAGRRVAALVVAPAGHRNRIAFAMG